MAKHQYEKVLGKLADAMVKSLDIADKDLQIDGFGVGTHVVYLQGKNPKNGKTLMIKVQASVFLKEVKELT
jgi:nucleoid DNA-binding protein